MPQRTQGFDNVVIGHLFDPDVRTAEETVGPGTSSGFNLAVLEAAWGTEDV